MIINPPIFFSENWGCRPRGSSRTFLRSRGFFHHSRLSRPPARLIADLSSLTGLLSPRPSFTAARAAHRGPFFVHGASFTTAVFHGAGLSSLTGRLSPPRPCFTVCRPHEPLSLMSPTGCLSPRPSFTVAGRTGPFRGCRSRGVFHQRQQPQQQHQCINNSNMDLCASLFGVAAVVVGAERSGHG